MDDKELLEKAGYQIVCESPFEIEEINGEGFASNNLAYDFVYLLRKRHEKNLTSLDNEESD
jgi:hypothetical protein